MLLLAVVLAAFVAAHAVLSRPWLRDPLVRRIGRSGYGAVNGILSLIGLVLVLWAYRAAPYIELWPPYPELRLAPFLLNPLAAILFVAGVTTPCAGLRGDRLPDGEDPAPGILSITRNPIAVALVLWAGAHIAANGDAAALLLFGTFLVFGAAAAPLVDRRRRRLCGTDAWHRFANATSTVPFARTLTGPRPVDWRGIGWPRVAAGLLLYLLLIALHQWFSGVPLLFL